MPPSGPDRWTADRARVAEGERGTCVVVARPGYVLPGHGSRTALPQA